MTDTAMFMLVNAVAFGVLALGVVLGAVERSFVRQGKRFPLMGPFARGEEAEFRSEADCRAFRLLV